MSTAQEIEEAIRGLPPAERDKLLLQIPQLFPEFSRDEGWNPIMHDERPRPALNELVNRYERELNADPEKFPRVAEGDFDTTA